MLNDIAQVILEGLTQKIGGGVILTFVLAFIFLINGVGGPLRLRLNAFLSDWH